MLDQTLVKKARRVLAKQIQTELDLRIAAVLEHTQSISERSVSGDSEPEDLATAFMNSGLPLWNHSAFAKLRDLRDALLRFDKVLAAISEEKHESGSRVLETVTLRDRSYYTGPNEFAANTSLKAENFNHSLQVLYGVFEAAGFKPVFRTDAVGLPKADLEICW